MSTDPNNKYVIIDLKDKSKCEGILVGVDKQNFLVNLKNARSYYLNAEGKAVITDFSEHKSISKNDIDEFKVVQMNEDLVASATPEKTVEKEVAVVKEDTSNYLPKPTVEIPDGKRYDKNDFFDNMKSNQSSNQLRDNRKLDSKNTETFAISKEEAEKNNYRPSRGNFRGRGRGGFRGGGRGQETRGRGGYNNYGNRNQWENKQPYKKNQWQGKQTNNGELEKNRPRKEFKESQTRDNKPRTFFNEKNTPDGIEVIKTTKKFE